MNNMLKHLVIKTCRDCPFSWSDYYREHFMHATCRHKVFHKMYDWEIHCKDVEQEEYEGECVPKWCPLENYHKCGDNNENKN